MMIGLKALQIELYDLKNEIVCIKICPYDLIMFPQDTFKEIITINPS